MSDGKVESDALLIEFEAVAKALDEVLKDIEWRKPDVEGEEATLKDLRAKAKKDPNVDVASQAIVVRVLRGVLDDKIAEADRLEKRLNEIKEQVETQAGAAQKQRKVGKHG